MDPDDTEDNTVVRTGREFPTLSQAVFYRWVDGDLLSIIINTLICQFIIRIVEGKQFISQCCFVDRKVSELSFSL